MVKKKAKPKVKKLKSKIKKKVSRKGPVKKKKAVAVKTPESMLEKIGEVTHYFPHVKAAAIKVLKDSIKVGDEIYIKGHTTDFKEKIASMQLDRAPIQEGMKDQEIGLLVKKRVRIGDSVYKF